MRIVYHRHIKWETGAGTSYCAFSLFCVTCVFCTILCTLCIFRYSVYLAYFPPLCVSGVFCIAVCPASQAEYKWGHGWVHTRTSAGSDMHTRSGWTSWPGSDFPCSHLTLVTYSKLSFFGDKYWTCWPPWIIASLYLLCWDMYLMICFHFFCA